MFLGLPLQVWLWTGIVIGCIIFIVWMKLPVYKEILGKKKVPHKTKKDETG